MTPVIEFNSKTFHLNPFLKRKGIGFISQQTISVSDTELQIIDGTYSVTIPIKELEYVVRKNRWFNLGNPEIRIGWSRDTSNPEEKNYLTGNWFYILKEDYERLVNAIKSADPICYRDNALIINRREVMFMNPHHVISSQKVKRYHANMLNSEDVKYVYSSGFIRPDLYIGTDATYLKIAGVKNDDAKAALDYLSAYNENFCESAAEYLTDAFHPKVLFSPKLWFTHSKIGFTEKGILYNQKTFKTNDNIFLPYDKVNLATFQRNWLWPFCQKVEIFGEQNILPGRKYSNSAISAIRQELDKRSVGKFEGECYTPSYLSKWWGVLLSITIVYYLLVMALKSMSKRNKLYISDASILWTGDVFAFNPDGGESRHKLSQSAVIVSTEDVRAVAYVKKRWFHLWGYICIWAHPSNIRVGAEEASQASTDYDLTMGKVWSWQASSIKSGIERAGFTEDSDRQKFYKKWAKSWLLED